MTNFSYKNSFKEKTLIRSLKKNLKEIDNILGVQRSIFHTSSNTLSGSASKHIHVDIQSEEIIEEEQVQSPEDLEVDDSYEDEEEEEVSPIEEIAQITPRRLDMDIKTRKSIISFNDVQKDLDEF